MLQSGSTSVLGRAYGVDEAPSSPVPAGSGGVVDLLQFPAARRRGGGSGGRKSCRASPKPEQRMVEGEAARGGGNDGVWWPATPSPLYIGGQPAKVAPFPI